MSDFDESLYDVVKREFAKCKAAPTVLELKALQAEVLDGDLTKVVNTLDEWMARMEKAAS